MSNDQWGPNGEPPGSRPGQRAPQSYPLGQPVIELTPTEVAWLSTDPTSLQALADWYHMRSLLGIPGSEERVVALSNASIYFARKLSASAKAIREDFTK